MFLRPEDKAKKKAQADENAILLTLRSEDACLHATHAFVYYDQLNHKDCLAFLKKALECDKRSSTAYRLWGVFSTYELTSYFYYTCFNNKFLFLFHVRSAGLETGEKA